MKRELMLTILISAAIVAVVSAVSLVVFGPVSGAEVSAHDGHGESPPWFDQETHALIPELVPARLPVSDRQGGIHGYIDVDLDPSDDPQPGDEGFELWNESKVVYDAAEGGNVIGRIWSELDGKTMVFVRVNEEATPGPVQTPGDDGGASGPVGGTD